MALQLSERHVQSHFGVTKNIKAKKCQLERIRRQRINDRLEKLKIIVMKHLGNDVGFYPPMEKADILEMAIRCLEGKENADHETSCLNKGDDTPVKREAFGKLSENTQSPTVRRRLEITPTREGGLLPIRLRTPSPLEPMKSICTLISNQPRTELNSLLNHPIKTFRECSKIDDVKHLHQSYEEIDTNQPKIKSNAVRPIWRPWTS